MQQNVTIILLLLTSFFFFTTLYCYYYCISIWEALWCCSWLRLREFKLFRKYTEKSVMFFFKTYTLNKAYMDMDDLQAKKHLRPRPHTSYNITIGKYVGSDLITLVFWSHFIVWTMYILYIYIFLSVFVAMFSGAVLALEDLSPKPSALVFFSKYMENFFGTTTSLFFF